MNKTNDFKYEEVREKLDELWRMVGNTPMIEIHYEYKGIARKIYAKCEHYNLTGSIKDRMALYILQKAYAKNKIKPGDRIIEASSGNSGISFTAIGRSLGHPVTIVMPDWLSKERVDIMRSLGADVLLISKKEGGFIGSIQKTIKMSSENADVFLPSQFDNYYNVKAHQATTAPEIRHQLENINQTPTGFVAGVSTGGTVMGVGKYLKKMNPQIRIHPLEPEESPTLSTGFKNGTHRIQGISDEFIPSIIRIDELDEIIKVSDGDSIQMAQQMAKQLGFGIGISSGANILGAIILQERQGRDAVVVTVLPDSNKKYLSTELQIEEPSKDSHMTPKINLRYYTPIRRAY